MSAAATSKATGSNWPAAKALILVGMMGVGKSEVGRRAAARLGLPFVDTDALVEARAGKTIAELFAAAGEGPFRQLEATVVAELVPKAQVIATGGGAVLSAANRDRLRTLGWVVWLQATPLTLVHRLRGQMRPGHDGQPPMTRLEQLFMQREPLYRAVADWTIATDGRHPDEVADQVVAAYRREAGGAFGRDSGL